MAKEKIRKPKPSFLEIAGLPSTGKTTIASLLMEELTKRDCQCIVVPEAAKRSPLSHIKRNWQFNAWTLCCSIASILEHKSTPAHDLIILDRSLVDVLCWIKWFQITGEIDREIADSIVDFVQIPDWFQELGLVVVLRASFETAFQRRGETGRILNLKTFQELERAYDNTINRLKNNQLLDHKLVLDTDKLSPPEVLARILKRVSNRWPELIKD